MTPTSVCASAPARIDLAGGTLDIWPLNLMFDDPVTLNMAVSIRAHACVTSRKDKKIRLVSEDGKLKKEFSSIRSIKHDHPLGLLSRLAEHFIEPGAGALIVTRSEAPTGAGMAGSSALTIALCAALTKITGAKIDKRKLIETAKDIEAAHLKIPTGLQDYGAAVYGSAHAFSFPPGGMKKEKLEKQRQLLEKRVVLFYSGASRLSGINNWEMFRRVMEKERKALNLFTEISECALRAVEALRAGNIKRFDKAINDEWRARKKLFPTISTPRIDKAIGAGKRAGATSARICGAGGGGCFFMTVEPDLRAVVINAVERTGCKHLPFSLSNTGLKIYDKR
ncbi:MAG TPA: GHMP kinase [Nitrospirae bacterium]|nr:GHMP kinase [Nitrospirota bacterium]